MGLDPEAIDAGLSGLRPLDDAQPAIGLRAGLRRAVGLLRVPQREKGDATVSIKRILGVLSLTLLSAPVMPGVPPTLASANQAEMWRHAGGRPCTFDHDLELHQRGAGDVRLQAPFSAKFEADRMSGTMGVTPIDGDCASKQTTCKCAGWWIVWRCAVK
jgi:hypothetical protein